jgi:hypothetical protein
MNMNVVVLPTCLCCVSSRRLARSDRDGSVRRWICPLYESVGDDHFPNAELIRVVLDNLNIHTPGALYEAFAPQEARRILRKLEFHYTPKHGSWLNMAEIEISILSRQCLKRRIATLDALVHQTHSWEAQRNQQQAKINWCFDLSQARTKLARLYP